MGREPRAGFGSVRRYRLSLYDHDRKVRGQLLLLSVVLSVSEDALHIHFHFQRECHDGSEPWDLDGSQAVLKADKLSHLGSC